MYSKKYRLDRIEEFNRPNPLYLDLAGCTCYLAYFNVGERGWFLYQTNNCLDDMHRIHTSTVCDVVYLDNWPANQIVVTTKNTKFTFTQIVEE